MTETALDRLRKRRDEEPTPWTADSPGDELGGTLVALGEAETKFGTYPRLTVKTPSGDLRSYVVSQAIPQRDLQEQQPEIGDTVLIYFRDYTEAKGDRSPAKIINVYIERLNAESNGEAMDPWFTPAEAPPIQEQPV
jgi:hypothetical protein